jgi:hypothetical protein
MTLFTDDVLHEKIRESTGVDVSEEEYLSFADPEESLRQDVARLGDLKTLPEGVTVVGLMYDARRASGGRALIEVVGGATGA